MSTRRNQIAVVSAALGDEPRSAVPAARAAGFDGLQFDAISSALDLTQLSQSGQREFAHLLRSHDQQLAALRADVGAKGLGPGADIDRLLSRLTGIMEAARALSPAPMVCLDLGPLPEPAAEAKPPPRITPDQAGLIILPEAPRPIPRESRPAPGPDPALIAGVDNALRELCVIADRTSVTVALRSDLASFAAIERALATAGCPWLGVDLDPVAMLRDEWSKDDVFSRLGTMIRHVRARDAIAGTNKRTRPAPIGRGSVRWDEVMSDLAASGFNGWMTIDSLELSDRRGAALAGLERLRAASA